MPRSWFDRHAVNDIEDEEQREFYRSVMADKKPYFMRYIYPALKKEYNDYIKSSAENCLSTFNMSIEEFFSIDPKDFTEEQKIFFNKYKNRMPVGVGDCVMNKICRRFEEEFDGYIGKFNAEHDFDYTILKSGVEYKDTQRRAIQKLYNEYNRILRESAIRNDSTRVDDFDLGMRTGILNKDFTRECFNICSSKRELTDIILDICYIRNSSKKFAWSIVGEGIIQNLLSKNDNIISFPTLTSDGDLCFCGETFTTAQIRLGDE